MYAYTCKTYTYFAHVYSGEVVDNRIWSQSRGLTFCDRVVAVVHKWGKWKVCHGKKFSQRAVLFVSFVCAQNWTSLFGILHVVRPITLIFTSNRVLVQQFGFGLETRCRLTNPWPRSTLCEKKFISILEFRVMNFFMTQSLDPMLSSLISRIGSFMN